MRGGVVPTFAEFAERWLRDYVDVNNKPSEQYTKRLVLRAQLLPVFGHLRLDTLSAIDIEQFKARALRQGLKPKSVNNYLTILRKCIVTAFDWSIIPTVPRFKLLRCAPPDFRFLEHAELARLVSAAGSTVWRDMIVVAARTGLRFSELIALQWDDVDFARRLLSVRRASVIRVIGTPKNYRSRHIPLGADVIETLASRDREGVLVFQLGGQSIRKPTAHRHLRSICHGAAIKPLGWHTLRHTYASHLAQIGTPLQVIMELLGHSSISMVLRYAHLSAASLTTAIAALDANTPRFGQPVGKAAHLDPTPSLSSVVSEARISAEHNEKHHAVA